MSTSIIMPSNNNISGSGKLLNFAYTRLTTTASQNIPANTQTGIAGLSIIYTPLSASSKLLISVEFNGSGETTLFGLTPSPLYGLLKNGASLGGLGFSDSKHQSNFTGAGLPLLGNNYSYIDDSINTISRTYQASVFSAAGEGSFNLFINREPDNITYPLISSITIQEIEQ